MGWNNPPMWLVGAGAADLRPTGPRQTRRATPRRTSAPGYSHKRPAYDADSELVQRPSRAGRAVRRAALPQQLQLPRRRQRPGGAGRGGGPARPARAGDHRPRRVLRRRRASPRRRRRTTLRDRLRRRALARADRPQNGVRRPRGQPPAGAGPRGRGLPPAGRGDHRGAAARRREGPAASTTSTSWPSRPAGTGWC